MKDLIAYFKYLNIRMEGKYEYNLRIDYRYDKEHHKTYTWYYLSKWELPAKESGRATCIYKLCGSKYTMINYFASEMNSLSNN